MNPIKTNLLWIVLALTNKWYYTFIIFFFINPASVTTSFSAVLRYACDLPTTHPFAPLAVYVCPRALAHQNDEFTRYNTAVVSGYSGLNDLISTQVAIGQLPNALVSVDDAIFLAKKSQIGCQEEVVAELAFMEDSSRSVGEKLEELKAKILSSVDL
jgi:hypothetical protein